MVISLILAAAILIGCSNTPAATTAATTKAPAATTAAATTAATTLPPAPEKLELPISTKGITLTVFSDLDGKAAVSVKSYAEIPAIQELMKRTGITLVFDHPAANNITAAFNLMIAANSMTDIVGNLPEGDLEKYVTGGQFLRLNEYMDKYAPNFKALLKTRPDVERDLKTDTGLIAKFPTGMRLDESILYFESFMVRADWMKKLKLEKPKTMDDWYKFLVAIRDGDPNGNGQKDEIPFIGRTFENMDFSRFGGAWGINTCWKPLAGRCYYVVDGKVKFGLIQPEFKSYLETMSKWYSEKLIDQDYLSVDAKAADAKILNNIAGTFYGKMNAQLGTLMGNKKDDPSFEIVALPFPTAPDGKTYDFNSTNSAVGGGVAISAKSKYIVEAVKMMDYLYSAEGNKLMYFGLEGVHHTMVNGQPVYTELITKNPDKLSMVNALAKYCMAGFGFAAYYALPYWNQIMSFPQQKTVYEEIKSATVERKMPQQMSLTAAETTKFSAIISEVQVYSEEMTASIVMGKKSITEFDKMVQTMIGMKIDEATAIQQAAYDRYKARK